MARIHLKTNDELDEETLATALAMEAAGTDTSTMRGLNHAQQMFDDYFQFYLPARKGRSLSEDLIELVRLRIARHNDCFTWLNVRLLQGAEHDLTESKIAQLDLDKTTEHFSAEEQLALEYADKLAADHHSMDDAFFARLATCFTDEQVLELGMMIGQFIGFGRLLAVLDLEPRYCSVESAENMP